MKLLRRATSGKGSQVSATDIRDEFFDGKPREAMAHKLRQRAAEADGFGERKARSEVKTVYDHPSEVTDETLRKAADLPDREALESDASAEFDELAEATVVTDGGKESPPPAR